MKRYLKRTVRTWLMLTIFLAACRGQTSNVSTDEIKDAVKEAAGEVASIVQEKVVAGEAKDVSIATGGFDLSDVPVFDGASSVVINGNVPFFTEDDLTTEAFETYSPLDSLGRCGAAYANICKAIMPTDDRGSIQEIKPTGWKQNKYEEIKDEGNPAGYLYNRCHLIAFELAGENANEENLITGTRFMNVEGMLQYENMVAEYVRRTDNHVLYRCTPIFVGDELLARGVLIEAKSVEDDAISICIYCYNVQPGIEIDYETGANHD